MPPSTTAVILKKMCKLLQAHCTYHGQKEKKKKARVNKTIAIKPSKGSSCGPAVDLLVLTSTVRRSILIVQ